MTRNSASAARAAPSARARPLEAEVLHPAEADAAAAGTLPSAPAAIPLGRLLQQAGAAVHAGLPDGVWTVATVSSVKAARGGASLELVEPDVAVAASGILRVYLPDQVLAAVRERMQRAVSADDLATMTVTLQLRVELHPRWGLSGRVTALGPGIEVSLARRAVAASLARLTRAGLLDRQRRITVAGAITRVAVIHPAAAAGWGDIAAELRRWAEAGVLLVRSLPSPFEGAGAPAGLVAALARAVAPLDGYIPDLVLVVRGGGASASLAALDDEALARAVAVLPVPVVTGLGHAVDLTLVDRVAWRPADTPSKALALLRDLLVVPARRARGDHAAILAAVATGLERAGPSLTALAQRVQIEARRRSVAAAEALEQGWSIVHAASRAARERLGRMDDALAWLSVDIAQAALSLLARLVIALDARMDGIRASARRSSAQAQDGVTHLTAALHRAGAQLAAADATLETCGEALPASVASQVARASADLEALLATARARAEGAVRLTDDGSGLLARIAASAGAIHREHAAGIERLQAAIAAAACRRLDAAAAALDRAAATLESADPARALARGFALVTDTAGHAVTSAAAAAAAETLLLTFTDGSAAVRVERP